MSNEAINAIERDIKEARKHVELGDSLERLLNNRDFKKVIVEGYFEKEAARLVHLKADLNFQTAEKQKTLLDGITAIGGLSQYFITVKQLASSAANTVASGEAVREELLAEDLSND